MEEVAPQKPHVEQPLDDEASQEALKKRGPIPRHVAIIMDGNGRWAEQQGRTRVYGHRAGTESVRDIAEAAAQIGIEYLTLYTFSTENWFRPAKEVNALMKLLVKTLRREKKTLLDNSIALNSIGDADQLPADAREALQETIRATRRVDRRMVLSLAISYSGRWDIVQAARRLAKRVQDGRIAPEDIDDEVFAGVLATGSVPDPDLMIRTGGESRISNFLLWQLAYTEIVFSPDFWPAFRRPQLYGAIRSFQDRDRRFGRVS